MYRGDFRRKATLAEYGFRLPSCMDNRPCGSGRSGPMRPLTVAVFGHTGGWEDGRGRRRLRRAGHPSNRPYRSACRVRPAKSQVDDVLVEIRDTIKNGLPDARDRAHQAPGGRPDGVICTSRACGCGTCIRTSTRSKRIEIIRDLRLGAFDVLVASTCCARASTFRNSVLVAILDADKEASCAPRRR